MHKTAMLSLFRARARARVFRSFPSTTQRRVRSLIVDRRSERHRRSGTLRVASLRPVAPKRAWQRKTTSAPPPPRVLNVIREEPAASQRFRGARSCKCRIVVRPIKSPCSPTSREPSLSLEVVRKEPGSCLVEGTRPLVNASNASPRHFFIPLGAPRGRRDRFLGG
jgi:hypothetical protein